ncbi:MAG TPA: ABC transporter substrate-binding protein [Clostridia bacterium]|nr:ABC transporter substrate-binding protein [Clostridia bacterium]
MKKIAVLLLIIILITLFSFSAFSCVKRSDKIIRLNEVTHSVFYAPMYVAINLGYFEEVGITIELTNGGGADKTMAAVIAGEADIGFCGPEAAVYVNAQGSKNYPIVFGQLTKKDGSFLIGRTPQPDFKWSDLKGKEIIGGRKGGMPAMSLEHALKANGLAIGSDLTLRYDIAFDLITAAFEGGTGEYCTMFEPVASQYEANGKGYVVASVGAEAGEVPYTCFMATKDYIEKNNDKVTKFMAAIIKGIKYIANSTNDEIATALVPSFPSTDKSLLIKSVASYKAIDAYMTSPVMTKANFEHMIDILIESGSLEKRVAFEDIIDNTIVEGILAIK